MSKLDVNENMKIGIDLKTIGQIVSLVVAGATMWFTLKGDVSSIELKMDAISEKVDRMYNNTSMEVIETKLESYDEKFEDNKDLVKELNNAKEITPDQFKGVSGLIININTTEGKQLQEALKETKEDVKKENLDDVQFSDRVDTNEVIDEIV